VNNLASGVGDFQGELERVHERLRENHLGAVRDLLTDGIILAACKDAAVKFRNRVLGPVVTVLHMIASAMSTNASNHAAGSFRAAWNEFGVNRGRHGDGRYPLARMVVGILWGTMTIVGYAVVPDRPDRNEPRAVCRERKHYPHLRGSRANWRANRAA
jgi:hypothetical protein